eukprot:TRINITY_DN2259_c0_g1_i1.p2 TRINITY_DN2259_c0_g1~~TRINITY_DN2259_c0_g1_i1.p2  ORF type:complete len:299 (+),score=107.98 TRINITY_DN2259_c0_g1_i1:80-898(+)
MGAIRRVPASRLFVSEPHPSMFGNPPNPSDYRSKGWTNANWLKSRFHFSFAKCSNPRNSQFGVLRVMNDDLVQPRTGFGKHPHRDMEILTYVVDGELTHQDSMGSSESLGRGSVQFMTAGSGLYHSEQNAGDTPCRFVQSWIVPRKRGLKPRYGSTRGDAAARRGQWQRLAGPTGSGAPIEIAQDAEMLVAEAEAGAELTLTIPQGRQGYLLCVEGAAAAVPAGSGAEAVPLQQHDGAELYPGAELRFTAQQTGMHLLVFLMAAAGSGRGDL